ncbi:MAG: membrane protein [Pirellulaceae bacterium]|nr:MAG: membrane protein [Pirellulaceae bacterium]
MSDRQFNWMVSAGVLCGAVSAVLYTATNVCLRRAAHLDPVWVSTVKAIPTILLVAPVLMARRRNRLRAGRSRRDVIEVMVLAVIVQVFGNVGFQWALSVLGLAISVPLVLGTMLVAGALIGKLMLGEPVTWQKWVAVVILIVATTAVSYGAHGIHQQGEEFDSRWVMLGIVAALASGVAYAMLGATMRRAMQRGMPLVTLLFIFSAVGVVLLGGWSLATIGPSGILQTTAFDWFVMFAAGTLNATAFFLLAKSLQTVPVLVVQMLNASQAALAALAGWLLFGEAISGWVAWGLVLTALGFVIAGVRRPSRKVYTAAEDLPSSLPVRASQHEPLLEPVDVHSA